MAANLPYGSIFDTDQWGSGGGGGTGGDTGGRGGGRINIAVTTTVVISGHVHVNGDGGKVVYDLW